MHWENHPSLLFLPVGPRQEDNEEVGSDYRPVHMEEVSVIRAGEAEVHTLLVRGRESGYLRVVGETDTVICVAVHGDRDASGHSIMLRRDGARKLTLIRVRRSMCQLLEGLSDVLVVPCPAKAQLTLQALGREAAGPGKRLYFVAKILELLAHWLQAVEEKRLVVPLEQRVALILQGDPASPPSAKVLAAMCGTTTATLTRRFRAAFGTTLRGYLRDL